MSFKTLAVVQSTSTVTKIKNKSIVVQTGSRGEKSFNFDGAFASTELPGIYSSQLSKLVHEALSGSNVSVTCCGLNEIGSGNILHGTGYNANNGIIPLIIHDLFDQVAGGQYLVSVSMLQINNKGELIDVLNPHTRSMNIKHNDKIGVYVENLSGIVCSNADEACGLYTEGFKAENALKMGQRDFIVTLYVSKKQQAGSSLSGILSKITIVDLIGHESEQENVGIKALFKAMGKGKAKKESALSNTNKLLHDIILNSSFAAVMACVSGEEKDIDTMMSLFDMVKSTSGLRLSPQKSSGDLDKLLTELRQDIKVVRDRMMVQNIPQKKDVTLLENLLSDLNAVKKTSWDQRIMLSNLYVEERKRHLADRGLLWVLEVKKGSNSEEIKKLQNRVEKLSAEYKDQKNSSEKLKNDLRSEIDQYTKLVESGNSDEKDTKARVTRIQQKKEAYKTESEKTSKIRDDLKLVKNQLRKEKEAGLDVSSFNFEMMSRKLEEDRQRMKTENQQLVDDEVEKLKVESAHEKAELEMRSSSGGLQLDANEQLRNAVQLATLKLEKSAITTQLDVLKKENMQMEEHIRVFVEKHGKEVEIQQLQNLQTFRAYREVFEEFKVDLENRWRGLLDDAIQDAVFLNSRNNELSQENEMLKMNVNELKDALSLTGTPPGKISTIIDK
uniref:kinesin-like protein KIN-7L n=1 Tax=Styela clava TaxID=7725 RepID=UPI00193AC486|nr:kinesin-like protein KIN-7L [Styela clava]